MRRLSALRHRASRGAAVVESVDRIGDVDGAGVVGVQGILLEGVQAGPAPEKEMPERADRIGQVQLAVSAGVSAEEGDGRAGSRRPVLLPGTELGEELIDAQPPEAP